MPGTYGAGERFGDYDILRVAGRGGMGVVYEARQRSLRRRVALKVLAPELADEPSFRRRFEREWRLASSLDHPHVVPVFAAGEEGDQLFLAMQWIDGRDLRTVLEASGAVAPDRAIPIIAQISRALDAAHDLGLLHRDIKPGNILIREFGDSDHAYLTDFGIGREIRSSATQIGQPLTRYDQIVGTPGYQAPEQLTGSNVDVRSDQYALGCVLFEVLTGTPPFTAHNDVAMAYAHMSAPRPLVSSIRPDLGTRFDEVVTRSLAINPDERYATGRELVRDLVAANREPVVRPTGAATQGAAAPPLAGPSSSPSPAPSPSFDPTEIAAAAPAAAAAAAADPTAIAPPPAAPVTSNPTVVAPSAPPEAPSPPPAASEPTAVAPSTPSEAPPSRAASEPTAVAPRSAPASAPSAPVTDAGASPPAPPVSPPPRGTSRPTTITPPSEPGAPVPARPAAPPPKRGSGARVLWIVLAVLAVGGAIAGAVIALGSGGGGGETTVMAPPTTPVTPTAPVTPTVPVTPTTGPTPPPPPSSSTVTPTTATLSGVDRIRVATLFHGYQDALTANDINALAAVLTDDVHRRGSEGTTPECVEDSGKQAVLSRYLEQFDAIHVYRLLDIDTAPGEPMGDGFAFKMVYRINDGAISGNVTLSVRRIGSDWKIFDINAQCI